MLKDELIALHLALRGSQSEPTASPVSQQELLRAPVERLLALLRDFVSVVELADEGTLIETIEACRRAVSTAADRSVIAAAVDACNNACRQVLAQIDHQRMEQKEEIVTLVGMVREALAIVAGDGQTFNKNLDSSMQRFEALVHITDVRQLKARLVHEIGELRQMAEERQQIWEKTCETFAHKVDSLERQLTATKQEASLDALTRIANRGAFERACREWIASSHSSFVLAMVDIDDFKKVNDAFGHTVGDRAIVAIAQALKNSVRSQTDVVARFGGDEFALLAANLTLRQAESRLRMLNASLTAISFEGLESSPKLTLSCGVAEFTAGDTVQSLAERADTALYEAKRLGKNRVVAKAKPTLRDMLRH